ncbi:hypothetical protein OHC51_21715 [Stenotrophomonas indicatrix]|uniref:hypothetical protein n=1 Tax=Stenotrophomonas indicatrix TaxID=2045451 RepID=UPI00300ADE9C
MSADPLVPQPSAVPSSRPHKRVRWRKAKGSRRPGVIDASRAELVRCLEMRQGAAWLRIKQSVVVAGYRQERQYSELAENNRVRSFRSDGAESLLALVVALLYLTDVRTGFIGKPQAGGGRWHRYTLRDIAQLAFGAQGDADVRRANRAIACMISIGWAYPSKQVRRIQDDGSFRSEAGVRRLNLSRICKMIGTEWLLKRDRKHADEKHGAGTADFYEHAERKKARDKWHQEKRESKARLEAAFRSVPRRSTGDGPPEPPGLVSLRDLFK